MFPSSFSAPAQTGQPTQPLFAFPSAMSAPAAAPGAGFPSAMSGNSFFSAPSGSLSQLSSGSSAPGSIGSAAMSAQSGQPFGRLGATQPGAFPSAPSPAYSTQFPMRTDAPPTPFPSVPSAQSVVSQGAPQVFGARNPGDMYANHVPLSYYLPNGQYLTNTQAQGYGLPLAQRRDMQWAHPDHGDIVVPLSRNPQYPGTWPPAPGVPPASTAPGSWNAPFVTPYNDTPRSAWMPGTGLGPNVFIPRGGRKKRSTRRMKKKRNGVSRVPRRTLSKAKNPKGSRRAGLDFPNGASVRR